MGQSGGRNTGLGAAKQARNNEFYTCMPDIEAELLHYRSYLRGKSVYCNCDDPGQSAFWEYFYGNFSAIGLRRLTATHYIPGGSGHMAEAVCCGGRLSVAHTELEGDGDFRSPECLGVLDACDVVVTNPPFSLFREYVKTLVGHGKEFLVIGNVNAVTYKEFFPLIKGDRVWPGFVYNRTMEFVMPGAYELKGKAYVDGDGRRHGFVPGICWYTNIDIRKRHEPIPLSRRYADDPSRYPKYDNYDAINVDRVADIPMDYSGVMGVPVTFLGRYCPEQFEILGIAQGRDVPDRDACPVKRYVNPVQHKPGGRIANGSKINTGVAVKVGSRPDGVYFTADNADGYLLRLYNRLLVRRRE